MNIKKLTALALFTALAMIIFSVESAIPPILPIPGIKLGLANIITLVLLQNYTPRETLLVLLMRIFLSSFLFGQAMSLMYSLAGGLMCFAALLALNRLLKGHYIYLTGILGGIFHNLGQLSIAFLITRTPGVLAYLPFLMISGILTGLFTGLCAHFLQKYLMPLIRKQ